MDLTPLAAGADAADRLPDWPAASWAALRQLGGFGWSTLPPAERFRRTETVASACLTTAFILSQHEAAVRQLLKGPPHFREKYLPAGDRPLTVGLSQLTTSRQHGGPALRATPTPGGCRLDGESPWVTAADRAAAVVIGATLPDGRQLLAVLPPDRPGVAVGPPLPLIALAGSRTAAVRCDGVELTEADILAGPTESVLGAVGGGGLDTSCLALGLASAATRFLRDEAVNRPHLIPAADRFEASLVAARRQLHALADAPDPAAVLALRTDATTLAVKASQAALMTAKGAGFVAPAPGRPVGAAGPVLPGLVVPPAGGRRAVRRPLTRRPSVGCVGGSAETHRLGCHRRSAHPRQSAWCVSAEPPTHPTDGRRPDSAFSGRPVGRRPPAG